MQYKSFRLRNFKGVADTTIKLANVGGANVVTLIGLNESGKTTILEGIYTFSPDSESKTLFDTKLLSPDPVARIPKSKLFSFNEDISIVATVALDADEKLQIKSEIEKDIGLDFDESGIPDQFTINDYSKYKNSKRFYGSASWSISLSVKSKKAKKWRKAEDDENRKMFRILEGHLPSIAYFPTFLSEVPSKVYLRGHSSDLRNSFYKRVFQDILDSLEANINIDDQIISRLEPPKTFAGSVAESIATFWGSSSKQMVQQVIDKASAQLSKIIVTRWNEMFDSNKAGKEIVIDWGVDEDTEDGVADPYISFAIKDGSNRYNIADRSLGFRWFFCFLLFTQFRAKRRGGKGTLFLFDEPASNLHAKAQEKLLDSFKDICVHPNALIYSTHSPYMINPYWLDQAYIVENSAVGADLEDIAAMSTSEDTFISTETYHDFVEKYPERMSHFQPVLDRLEVKPSLMDISKKSVLVEGKSDYLLLKELSKGSKVIKYDFIPCHGATTMASLISLLRGWGWAFVVLLDGDKAGKEAKAFYQEEYNLSDNLLQLSDVDKTWKGVESILHAEDKIKIQANGKPSKKQIYTFFSQNAVTNAIDISKFKTQKGDEFKKLISYLDQKLG